MEESKSVQRSFRLSPSTTELLDREAEMSNESRNALADRLLGEALRLEHHSMIRFQQGAAGRRRPLVAGTRLYVYQVIATLREHSGSVEDTAAYFGVERRLVQSALEYYADFRDEIDTDKASAQRVAEIERARWERQKFSIELVKG
jgi:uncharacterized protein (DUF433 family)